MKHRDNSADVLMPPATPRRGTGSLWLWVILAFVLLITAWTLLIWIASKNAPEMLDPHAARTSPLTRYQLSA